MASSFWVNVSLESSGDELYFEQSISEFSLYFTGKRGCLQMWEHFSKSSEFCSVVFALITELLDIVTENWVLNGDVTVHFLGILLTELENVSFFASSWYLMDS